MSNASSMREVLEAAGCRYTPQRAAVLAYLRSVTCHPTVEQVHEEVRKSLPRISLATVYNTLELLVSVGLVQRLSMGNHAARYDARVEPHYHLHDVVHDEVHDLDVEFDPHLLDRLDPQLRERLAERGYRVTGYRLEVDAVPHRDQASS